MKRLRSVPASTTMWPWRKRRPRCRVRDDRQPRVLPQVRLKTDRKIWISPNIAMKSQENLAIRGNRPKLMISYPSAKMWGHRSRMLLLSDRLTDRIQNHFFSKLSFRDFFLSNIFLLQAINESRGRQLTLNEIYNWFQVRQRHRANTISTFTSTESLKAPFSCLRQILRSSVVTPPLGK